MSILASTLDRVNFDHDSDAPTLADLDWWAAVSGSESGWFDPDAPSPPPSDADAPAEPEPDAPPPSDADAINAIAIIDRLILGRPTSLAAYNAARVALGYDAYDAECYCTLPPDRCCCGNELYETGVAEFTTRARNARAELDAYYDALATEHDPYARDREHANRACFA